MRNIELITSAFRAGTPREESHEIMEILLRSLVSLNVAYLRRHPHGVPSLDQSGVFYMREPKGYEQWLTIPMVLQQGHADCEDLAAYRCAWLQQREGIPAWTCFKWRRRGDALIYHILVCKPDGTIEDPSRELGMGWGEDRKGPLAFPHTTAAGW